MSADLAYSLALALKMALTAGFVVAASHVTERAGPVIGALVSTLPVSAGPAYVFVALDHGADFIAASALTSLAVNAVTAGFALVYVVLAQRRGALMSLVPALTLWFVLCALVQRAEPSLAAGIALNVGAFAVLMPLARRFVAVTMPPVRRYWYDVPLRAALVALLVAIVVATSAQLGPAATGVLALFPIVLSSLVLILHPRIGGRATAALVANAVGGLAGFGVAVVVLHAAALHAGAAVALVAALATAVAWNLGLWALRRRGLPL